MIHIIKIISSDISLKQMQIFPDSNNQLTKIEMHQQK
jgi:hypothetical protein